MFESLRVDPIAMVPGGERELVTRELLFEKLIEYSDISTSMIVFTSVPNFISLCVFFVF